MNKTAELLQKFAAFCERENVEAENFDYSTYSGPRMRIAARDFDRVAAGGRVRLKRDGAWRYCYATIDGLDIYSMQCVGRPTPDETECDNYQPETVTTQ